MDNTRNVKNIVAAIVLFGSILYFGSRALMGVPAYPYDEKLYVHVLDVGQGEAILIHTPNGKNVLIDGGPNTAILEPLSTIFGFGQFTIDVMIASHPHADHISGLIEVVERMSVGEVWYTAALHTTPTFKAWLQSIKENTIPLTHIKRAETKKIDGIDFEIIYPDQNISEKGNWVDDHDGLNDTSLIIRMVYGNTSFLFTGDAEEALENYILQDPEALKADVLKIGHHGSHTSTEKPFLEAVDPEYAVISVGENDYGHPSKAVLSRLNKKSIQTFRTDKHGTITFISDGKEINFHTTY